MLPGKLADGLKNIDGDMFMGISLEAPKKPLQEESK
jgi:hypothetical protein